MVDSGPRLEVTTHWFPTKASGERLFAMQLEYSLNGHPEPGHPSFVEMALTSGVAKALDALPSILPKKAVREARRLLQPWPDGRYTDAYQRTGHRGVRGRMRCGQRCWPGGRLRLFPTRVPGKKRCGRWNSGGITRPIPSSPA